MHGPRIQDKPGHFFPTVNRSPEAAKKYSHVQNLSKSIMYNTDGTGRDGYVTCGNGGFTNPMNQKQVALDPRIAFQRSLRGYEPDGDYLNRRKKYANKRRMYSNATTNLVEEGMMPDAMYNGVGTVPSAKIGGRGDRKSVDMIMAKQIEVS